MIAAKDGQIENVYVANWKKTGIDGEAGVEGVNGVVGAAVNAANEMPPLPPDSSHECNNGQHDVDDISVLYADVSTPSNSGCSLGSKEEGENGRSKDHRGHQAIWT